jgi:hypothetical protein
VIQSSLTQLAKARAELLVGMFADWQDRKNGDARTGMSYSGS